MTNEIVTRTAVYTNKSITLNKEKSLRPIRTPYPVRKAKRRMNQLHRRLKSNSCDANLRNQLREAQKEYRRTVRRARLQEAFGRDAKICAILEDNPSAAHNLVRSQKDIRSAQIEKLIVGDQSYTREFVADGFYSAMSNLKSCDMEQLREIPEIDQQMSNYEHIIKLCSEKKKIPSISMAKSVYLLQRIKKNVADFYSITSLHYINAGQEGLMHFNTLLNGIIENVNNAKIHEIDIAHGKILYKGGNKDRSSERSYRTISTCPFISKCLDLYIRNLYMDHWNYKTAKTQYSISGLG